jgi:hypothetical protein
MSPQTKGDLKMSKSAKNKMTASSVAAAPARRPPHEPASDPKSKKSDRFSKQSRVIAMLQSPTGATIAAMMKVTGWQQHSVRGFLAGVVRKRLKLKLDSKLRDDERVYRLAGDSNTGLGTSQPKRTTD